MSVGVRKHRPLKDPLPDIEAITGQCPGLAERFRSSTSQWFHRGPIPSIYDITGS